MTAPFPAAQEEAFCRACENGESAVVRHILARCPGALEKSDDTLGLTPLIRATQSAQTEIVELLLSCGADPARRDRQNRTAADWASVMGFEEPLGRLLRAEEKRRQQEAGRAALAREIAGFTGGLERPVNIRKSPLRFRKP